MNTLKITLGSLIKIDNSINIYEVYSIRNDGKFYYWNICNRDEQYTGYLDNLEGIKLIKLAE